MNGKSRASFPWTFSCATMGLAVSVSLCFAQGDRDVSQELQRVQEMTPFLCDSLDPKVCIDIYQHRMEPAPKLGWWQGRVVYEKPWFTPEPPYDYVLSPKARVEPCGGTRLLPGC
jgi:hypothetical protein